MINPVQVALISYALLSGVLIGPPQSTAPTEQPSIESKRIKIIYDKTKNETIMSLPFMLVRESPGTIEARFPEGTRKLPSEILQMTAYFSYPGKTLIVPGSVVLGFLSLSQGEAIYSDDNEVIVRVDSTSLSLGRLKVADRRVDANIQLRDIQFWRETLELPITTQKFLRIANGKNVSMRLGLTEFNLSANHMKSLRELASKISN